MNDIILNGCTPTPLASYLKALGVLRLLAGKYPETRGYWRAHQFVVTTSLDRQGIEQFFLHEYMPTPIISPWSGRAGFLEGDDGQGSKRKGALVIERIEKAAGERFKPYQRVVSTIRKVSMIQRLDQVRVDRKRLDALKKAKKLDQAGLDQLSTIKRQEGTLKDALLRVLRNELDDAVVPWIDACFALVGDDRSPGPLLGSGGNEGSMDFSINHIGYLLQLIDENTDAPASLSSTQLDNSLFGTTCPRDASSNIGFLDTLATGGVNMSAGFEGESTGNIWDSVLALEGAVLFASLTTKRLESTASGRPSFPFAVAPSYAGSGSLAQKESARSELWLPLWNRESTLAEIQALLAEGRITKGKREARNGIDMLQAISSLGTERGICAFNRFGFFERRGQGYYVATHLGRFEPPKIAHDDWVIADLNRGGWLDTFRKFAHADNTAVRFGVLRKRLEDRLFDLSGRQPRAADAQALLTLLGDIQSALADSPKARESVPPVPRLSEKWVQAADDGTSAFRIAKALAGLRGVNKEHPLPLRAQWFPVERVHNYWVTEKTRDKARVHVALPARLPDALGTLLARRLWLAERLDMRDKPLSGASGAMLDDVAAFLRDNRMDAKIAPLLPGLCLCAIPADIDKGAGNGAVPAAFALLKLALTPDWTLHSLGHLSESERMPIPVGLVARLQADTESQGQQAVLGAWRRLHSSGLSPVFTAAALPALAGIDPHRMAAALLIPLRYGATGALARQVLKQLQTTTV